MNPLLTDKPFALSLMNPNPTSRRGKEGPVYRVSFELNREEWDHFMEAEVAGMVIECRAMVTHRNVPLPMEVKPKGPGSDIARELHAGGFFRATAVVKCLCMEPDATEEEVKVAFKKDIGISSLTELTSEKLTNWIKHYALPMALLPASVRRAA